MSIVSILLTPSAAATEAATGAATGESGGIWADFGGQIITGIVALAVFTLSQFIDWRKRIGDRETYKNNAVLGKVIEDHWKRIADYRELATKSESFASKLPHAYSTRIHSELGNYNWYDEYGRNHDLSEEIEEENKRLTEEVRDTRQKLEDLIKVYAGESKLAANELEALKTAISQTMDRYWTGLRRMDTDDFDASSIEKAVAALRSRIMDMEKQVPVK